MFYLSYSIVSTTVFIYPDSISASITNIQYILAKMTCVSVRSFELFTSEI